MLALSPELALMLAPERTYRELARRGAAGGSWDWLPRFLLLALVVGTSVALAASGRISPGLLLSCSACWCVAPAAQAGALFAVARPRPFRSFARLLELFLLSHAPWSLWLLLLSLWVALSFPEGVAGWWFWTLARLSALVPAWWTLRLVYWYFREVTGLPHRRALLATAWYELALLFPAFVAFWLAAQLWPRVLGLL
jgi:hypothetical protein